MTTTDHAAEAERLIRSAGEFMAEGDAAAHDRCIATAQVHATLATAARSRADARIAALRAALSDIFVKSTDGVATVTAINALRADDTETG